MSWIFLSGMMGSGKSTVGRALARRRRARFVDLDAKIEGIAGRSVRRIFAEGGEAAFRRIERETLAGLLEEEPAVIALGGGTILDRDTRWRLLERGALVTLVASTEELARRVGEGEDRPLLAGEDPAVRLARIAAQRRDAYLECHAEVRTEGRDVDAIAREVEGVADRRALVVPLGARTYRVEVGRGVRGGWCPEATGALFVTDANVREPWAEAVRASGRARAPMVVLEPGEAHKTIGAVERIWDAGLDAGLDRDAVLVAVGGGVVGDLTGFAAATLLRGVRFVSWPTSMLAMVDASVGGKTGFDRPQGKNLVGAFHQPAGVHVDLETLRTLPPEELRSGLAEVVKAAWLDSEEAVAALERDAEALLALDPDVTEAAVRRAIALKIRVVARDEREGGLRRQLNLGHTLGHAMEAAGGYVGLRHGEAVGLGMLAAFDVAAALGDAEAPGRRARVARLLERLGLPTDLAGRLRPEVLGFLRADKKRVSRAVRFVVPGAPGATRIEEVPFERLDRLFGSGVQAPVE